MSGNIKFGLHIDGVYVHITKETLFFYGMRLCGCDINQRMCVCVYINRN